MVRGVRGAITALTNTPAGILDATRELLRAMMQANALQPEDVVAAFFTVTPDLDAAFPATAARELGWVHVPLMCAQEPGIKGGLPRCIRVLILFHTNGRQEEVRHVYLREAAGLRPDLVAATADTDWLQGARGK